MKKSFIVSIMMIAVTGVFLNSCLNKAVIPDSPAISFSKEVQPIIVGNCSQSGCHDTTSRRGEDFALMTYNEIMTFGRITPSNANKSRLYKALFGGGEGMMPPSAQLPDKQILTIYLWIEQGAQDN